MTSGGDSFSVASSSRACSTAPTTPRSTHSSSVHRNLRRGSIDPRIQEDEEYDPDDGDPFAQNDAEYAKGKKEALKENDKEKYCLNALAQASDRLIALAEKGAITT